MSHLYPTFVYPTLLRRWKTKHSVLPPLNPQIVRPNEEHGHDGRDCGHDGEDGVHEVPVICWFCGLSVAGTSIVLKKMYYAYLNSY